MDRNENDGVEAVHVWRRYLSSVTHFGPPLGESFVSFGRLDGCGLFSRIVISLMQTTLFSMRAAMQLTMRTTMRITAIALPATALVTTLMTGVVLAPVALEAQSTSAVQDSSSTQPERPAVVKHTVKRGDTLWDIAKFYLKDPFRWPDVFHANTDIVKNPHWIYPGQVLTIEGSAVRDDVAARVDDKGFLPEEESDRDAGSSTAFATHRSAPPPKQAVLAKPPVFTIRRGEYDAAPFMVDQKKPLGNGVIAGTVDRMALGLKSDAGFQLNDQLYVTAPTGTTLHRGDLLLLAHVGDVVIDVGRVIEPVGVLRVDSLTSRGIAMGPIIHQYGQIARDAVILPFDRSFEETTVRPVVGAYGVKANVIWIKSAPILSSLQTYVMVDAPARSVRPGDQFTLYDDAKQNDDGIEIPPVATATIQVVRVTPYGATGVIVTHQQPMVRTGMAAQLTAKMP